MIQKDKLFEILLDWNYWDRDFSHTYTRDIYKNKISKYSNQDEVIILTGVRRSGKSTLMLNEMKRLHSCGVDKKNMLFINFEDSRLINFKSIELLELIKETYLEFITPDTDKPYIFLDEIQNITNWENWVNTQYELKKFHIYATGSNSSLLSSEIGSSLSGRYISIHVQPLSFIEFLKFKNLNFDTKLKLITNKTLLNKEFDEYISFGAFPKIIQYKDRLEKRELLKNYFDSILLKDIVARFKLKNYKTLEELASFLLGNSATINSISNIKNHFNISYDMARDYMEYLQKSYMIIEIYKFDYSLKKQIANAKKYYSIDLGLSKLVKVPNINSIGHDIETVVLLELLRRGYKVYYYKTKNNLEIDFVIQQNNQIVELIQVSYSIENEKTIKREIAPFPKAINELRLNDNIKCTVLTNDTNIPKSNKINIINIIEWLCI